MQSSSADLHPTSGARFVCLRTATSPLSYAVEVWLPAPARLQTVLSWDAAGHASIAPPLDDAWAQAELVKLARVLHRDGRERLTRWRGRDER